MTESGTNPSGNASRGHEGAYQEIHAAIQELYRLMGVPRQAHPAAGYPGEQYFPGYSVYTYPSASAAYMASWPTGEAPSMSGSGTPIMNQQQQPPVAYPGTNYSAGSAYAEGPAPF